MIARVLPAARRVAARARAAIVTRRSTVATGAITGAMVEGKLRPSAKRVATPAVGRAGMLSGMALITDGAG